MPKSQTPQDMLLADEERHGYLAACTVEGSSTATLRRAGLSRTSTLTGYRPGHVERGFLSMGQDVFAWVTIFGDASVL